MEKYSDEKTFVFSKIKVEEISEISSSRLAYSYIQMVKNPPGWIKILWTGEKCEIYEASFMALHTELYKRTSSGTAARAVKEVMPTLAATHTISVNNMSAAQNKTKSPIEIYTNEYKVLKVKEIAGYTLPTTYPNLEVRGVMTSLADAAFFSVTSKDLEKRLEIDVDHAAHMQFPVKNLSGMSLPSKMKRVDFIANTVAKMCSDKKYAKQVQEELLSKSVTFDAQTGKFKVTTPRVLKVKSIPHLFLVIDAWRKIRGTDADCRSDITAGYYYALSSRSLYKTAYLVHDILYLGIVFKTKYLEIGVPDNVVSAYVLSSLVATGWLIRVIGSNAYSKYNGEKSGIFSYFPIKEMYLRYVPLNETAPRIVGSSIIQPPEQGVMVTRNFGAYVTDNCVAFSYAYLHKDMMKLSENYKGITLFPTAHAHNGHVIVVNATVDYKFDIDAYMKRVSLANTFKTYYVYTRSRFLEHDPFGHRVDLILRNRILPPKSDDNIDLDEETKVEFSKTFAIRSFDNVDYNFLEKGLMKKKRDAQRAIEAIKESEDISEVATERIQQLFTIVDEIDEELVAQDDVHVQEEITIQQEPFVASDDENVDSSMFT
jgi:hypothetical protein